MSDIKGSEFSREYAKEWVTKSDASVLVGQKLPEEQYEQGLATCLYLGCVDIVKFIFQDVQQNLSEDNPFVKEVEALGKELGRLYLWGESLTDGSLDKAIDQSDELKRTVLASLRDIAQEVMSCK